MAREYNSLTDPERLSDDERQKYKGLRIRLLVLNGILKL